MLDDELIATKPLNRALADERIVPSAVRLVGRTPQMISANQRSRIRAGETRGTQPDCAWLKAR